MAFRLLDKIQKKQKAVLELLLKMKTKIIGYSLNLKIKANNQKS